jgi:hypothetical protein
MHSVRHCLVTLLVCGAVAVRAPLKLAAAPPESDHASATVAVNRTVPKVKPPKTTLEFSAHPTTQEIFRARIFADPLVLIGGEPSSEENTALAVALFGYPKRSGPDDFASLTAFLEKYPQSPWRAALLTGLGFEYYTTAHYPLALAAWRSALEGTSKARDVNGMVVLARAEEELALLYARLGRMTELEALLKPFQDAGDAAGSQKIKQAREALWLMHHQPEVSFRCGPLALRSILTSDPRLLTSFGANGTKEIADSASTTNGFSLPQVAELSKKVGLSYQMAFRSSSVAL